MFYHQDRSARGHYGLRDKSVVFVKTREACLCVFCVRVSVPRCSTSSSSSSYFIIFSRPVNFGRSSLLSVLFIIHLVD